MGRYQSSWPLFPPIVPVIPTGALSLPLPKAWHSPIMGDSSKSKSSSIQSSSCNSHSSNGNVASLIGNQDFAPWPDLDAQILASPSPVSSAKDLRVWLEKKGWLLNSEAITKNHLADILFSASLAFKLPNEANVTICSVASILQNLSDIDKSHTLVNNQVSIKLSDPIISLNLAISSANNFLEVATQQQASDLISIKEVLVQQHELVKSLADAVKKSSALANPRGLVDASWPPLPQSSIPPLPGSSGSVMRASYFSSSSNNKLLQCISLTSKQILIDYGPLAPDDPPRDKSIEAQHTLRGMFNDWIDISTPPAEEGAIPLPPSHVIQSVLIFNSPSALLEFNLVDSKTKFEKICTNKPELLAEFSHKAHIRPCTYAIILCFVPCSGQFNPSNAVYLREVKFENDILPNYIALAVWCKHPDKRSSNQKTATLKVLYANPEAANLFITGQICINDHLVNVHKDIKLPIWCLKCQEYGHTWDLCIGVEKCANCASVSHSTSHAFMRGPCPVCLVELGQCTLAPHPTAQYLPKNVPC